MTYLFVISLFSVSFILIWFLERQGFGIGCPKLLVRNVGILVWFWSGWIITRTICIWSMDSMNINFKEMVIMDGWDSLTSLSHDVGTNTTKWGEVHLWHRIKQLSYISPSVSWLTVGIEPGTCQLATQCTTTGLLCCELLPVISSINIMISQIRRRVSLLWPPKTKIGVHMPERRQNGRVM